MNIRSSVESLINPLIQSKYHETFYCYKSKDFPILFHKMLFPSGFKVEKQNRKKETLDECSFL